MTEPTSTAVRRIVAGPWSQNCYVVAAGNDAVLVDPGDKAEEILSAIAADRLRVHAVLLTHGHYDHVGALAETATALDAPVAMHSADARTLGRVNLYRYALHKWDPIDLPEIQIDLASNPTFDFGKLPVDVLHTPGHTPGSVCFAVGEALFTGDTLVTFPMADSETREADAAALRGSMRLLTEAYPAETTIHPGHGEPSRLGAGVSATLARRSSRA